jgi:cysteinyl-tRNA synthetase
VRIYVCGPTVYDRAHLGNARPVVVFDVLYRLLRHAYGAEHVTYVRNFTDVDDKINAEALRRREAGAVGSLEELIRQRTEETIGWYHADMDALGALRPDHEPRATAFIGPMVAMIETLMDRGHAYVAEGHVLFDVRSYADYGRLSGRSLDDMIAGARVEVAPFKRDPLDFVLWKPSDAETPGWPSPWGRGRPGWHIECSAMARDLLGGAFDIHGGGIDLAFPHHENEIAQSRCAHPDEGFARIWMHNEMLMVEGKKMSKSLGNFFTVRDLLDQGVPGEVIRFVLLGTHYSKPMDWTESKRREAVARLDQLLPALTIWVSQKPLVAPSEKFDDLPLGMQTSLADDLNTSAALVALDSAASRVVDSYRRELRGSEEQALIEFAAGLSVLGLYDLMLKRRARRADGSEQLDWAKRKLQIAYVLASQTRDFDVVDKLKAKLSAAGVEVRISGANVTLVARDGFDAAALEDSLR